MVTDAFLVVARGEAILLFFCPGRDANLSKAKIH